ncbi:MAG: outer membrane beta-barrel protein [Ignavibacteriae bacterium]|nr:outer membrane beta-barrel protein [Ignavibacteriota bacterium]
MKTTIITTLCLLAILCSAAPAGSDGPIHPEDRILFPGAARFILAGPYGGIDAAFHTGRFSTTSNGLLCCSFDEGDGIGLVAGFKAFIPIGGRFDLSPRILYENPGGDFTAILQQYPIRGRNNAVEFVTLDNTLEVTLHMLSAELLATYTFTSFGLYAALGPSAGFILGNRFVKTETIAGPPGVTYLDGSTSKEMYAGSSDIVRGSVFTLRGGLGAKIPISRSITLNPEVLYGFPLSTVSTDGNWKVSTLQATLGVLFPL